MLTGNNFAVNKYCVYIIKKDNTKLSVSLNFTQVNGADAYVFRGGKTFNSTMSKVTFVTVPTNLLYTSMNSTELLYVIVRGKNGVPGLTFYVNSY